MKSYSDRKALTVAERLELWKKHNLYRAKVRRGEIEDEPPAESLPMLRWNRTLGRLAQQWAVHCRFEHEPNQETGENLAFATYRDWDPLKAWFDEHVNYTYGRFPKHVRKNIAHYTQLVWAETRSVGCHIEKCSKLHTKDGIVKNAYYTVCKYWPPGNYVGEYPYVRSRKRRSRSHWSGRGEQ
ncbi:unnamed protein product [Dicrocoelium dendriticum]|nr:unnamed protein product [Dicrocoelium dendriticum]